MLEVKDLHLSYGMHRALGGINITVGKGEIVVILGANGAGKSSLLHSIAGISEGKVTGDIVFEGRSLRRLEADAIVEQGIAFVPEGRGVFGELSVEDNLALGAYSKRARSRQQQNMRRVLSLFPKLQERRKQLVRTMSGGEQQMVAIGRAMMADPRILMLDEPSLGLSPLLCKELFQALTRVKETGVSILLVEQNAKQSLAIAGRGYLIENGQIVGQNTAKNLLNDPAVQSAYLGVSGGTAKAVQTPPAGSRSHAAAFKLREPTTLPGTGAVASDSLEAIIARASGSKHQYRQQSIAAAPSLVQPASGTASGVASGTARVVAIPLTDTNASRSPEVSRLLADMEQAARNAIRPLAHEQTVAQTVRRPQEEDGPLPHIEVIRKRTVEIYKRNHDNKLVKSGSR